jgi:hypothetical protein
MTTDLSKTDATKTDPAKTEAPDTTAAEASPADAVADIRAYGAVTTMLGNLSRYVDNAASAFLAGDVRAGDLVGYLTHAKAVYASLRAKVIAALTDEARAAATAELWEIPADADVLATSLLVDQSLAWTATLLQVGNLERQLRITKMNLDLEEHAATERFRDTVTAAKRTTAGLYA